jgi:hydroxylaminobenzene mutase
MKRFAVIITIIFAVTLTAPVFAFGGIKADRSFRAIDLSTTKPELAMFKLEATNTGVGYTYSQATVKNFPPGQEGAFHESQPFYVEKAGHRLLQLGIFLFLIGLLTGFVSPKLANPRMGLSSHLEGILNGFFLMLLGLLWPKLSLSQFWLALAFWLAIYGTFANWAATLLAAIWGAGASMPIAAVGHQGTPRQEIIIIFLLYTLSAAMVVVSVLVLWGLTLG